MKEFKRLLNLLPFWLIVAGMVIIYFNLRKLDLLSFFKHRIKFTKQEFSKLYNVDKRTINKWMNCFFDKPLYLDNKRKLSLDEMIMISTKIGNPLFFPVISRTDLATLLGIKLEMVQKVIAYDQRQYGQKIQLDKMRKFPPFLGKRILKRNSVSKEQIRVYFKKKDKKLPIFFKY